MHILTACASELFHLIETFQFEELEFTDVAVVLLPSNLDSLIGRKMLVIDLPEVSTSGAGNQQIIPLVLPSATAVVAWELASS